VLVGGDGGGVDGSESELEDVLVGLVELSGSLSCGAGVGGDDEGDEGDEGVENTTIATINGTTRSKDPSTTASVLFEHALSCTGSGSDIFSYFGVPLLFFFGIFLAWTPTHGVPITINHRGRPFSFRFFNYSD
jgi:hypothetical protein